MNLTTDSKEEGHMYTQEQMGDQIELLNQANAGFEEKMSRMVAMMELIQTTLATGNSTTSVKPEPGETKILSLAHKGVKDITDLIRSKGEKQEIIDSAKAIEPLEEKDGVINTSLFKAKFEDYLDTLGLKQAVAGIQISQIDITNDQETVEVNQSKINQLLALDSLKPLLRQAHSKLKGSIKGNLYQSLVMDPDSEAENFFTLWHRVCRLVGNTGTLNESIFLMADWEKLRMEGGRRLSEHYALIDKIANRVNMIQGKEIFGDFHKIARLKTTLEDFPIFQQPLSMHTSTQDKNWTRVKAEFFKFSPRSSSGEELPISPATTPAHIANSADANTNICKLPNHGGHLAKDCRAKRFTGKSNPNNECMQWVNHGKCTWTTNPKNKSKNGCRFNHGPGTKGKGNWDATKRTVSPEAEANTATTIPNPDENKDVQDNNESLKKQVLSLTKIVKGMFTSAANSTGTAQTTPTHVPQTFISILEQPEDTTDCFGWCGTAEADKTNDAATERTTKENPWHPLTTLQEVEEDEDSESDISDEEDEFVPETHTPKPTLQNQAGSNQPSLNFEKKSSALPLSYGFTLIFRPLTLILLLLTVLSSGVYEGEANVVGTTQPHPSQHEILLDTGCTDSATGFLDWLMKRLPTNWTMSTANNSKSKATCRGTAIIAGLPLKLVHVPDFKRTLISWTDLNDMGYTATMGANKIDIFTDKGKFWTTVNKGKDRLWHFTAAEQEQVTALN
jgi:hypothetical protein